MIADSILSKKIEKLAVAKPMMRIDINADMICVVHLSLNK